MKSYSITPYHSIIDTLDDERHYSIPGLRQKARQILAGSQLTEFTEALIWNRTYHDFPREGDGIEEVNREPYAAWSGARWKSLLPQKAPAPKTTWLNRLLRMVA